MNFAQQLLAIVHCQDCILVLYFFHLQGSDLHSINPDELPVEVWKCMGKMGIEFLTRLYNRLLMGEQMPEEWRRSVLIPIYKNKGDAQCGGNYREIKLMSHTMKVWERIIEARLRDRVEISKQQYGFMP